MTFSMQRRTVGLVLAGLGGLLLAGCFVSVTDGTGNQLVPGTTTPSANNPIINALTANPTNVTKGQAITVSIRAQDPKQQPLDYAWSATGGTLSTTTGQLVQWIPPTEPGTYTINVLVSNGTGGSTAGSLNLVVAADGGGVIGADAPQAEPSSQPSAEPTPAPSASPAADTVPGKILYQEDFEAGLENLVLINSGQLKWTSAVGNAHAGNAAAAFNDGDAVQPGAIGSGSLNFKKYLDLSDTKLPRVRFAVRNTAAPASAVTFQSFWLKELPTPGWVESWTTIPEIGSRFSASSTWTIKDLDLSAFKTQPGYLRLSVSVSGQQSEAFSGPMIDSVTIYDAGAK